MIPLWFIHAGVAMPSTRLATFIHISDLHFGRLHAASGDAAYSQLATQVYSNQNWLDGLLGHHGRALKELHAFVSDLKKTEPDLRLIVSGDLSRCGHNDELDLARKYIDARIDLNPPLGNMVGLRLGEPILVIPGNHDQWGGTQSPFGNGASNYTTHFPRPMPFIHTVPLGNGKRIVFIGIDSDADVAPRSLMRTLAIGAFESQLNALNKLLPPRPADEFRVLLIHHSWSQRGATLRMAPASKWALENFIYYQQISALLCGHSHLALLQPFQARSGLNVRDVHELRAGSTAQLDAVPPHWRTVNHQLPVKPGWTANTLLVHRIFDNSGAMEWDTETWIRGKRGFKPLPSAGHAFALV
jgi:hypothetical protein